MQRTETPLSNTFGVAIRHEFVLEDGVAQLNHGSYGATPRRVLETQHRWRLHMEAELSRFMGREFRPALRAAAKAFAPWVGADADGIAWVENATLGANAVLRDMALAPGDEILITDQTYGAVRNTVLHIASRTGAKVVEVSWPFPTIDPTQVTAAIAAGLSERTRIAVLDHITSPTALVLPIADMVRAAKEAGALVLVDGAHGPGQVPIDLSTLGADWYTGNCHKWLCAAKGCGFLWTAPEHRAAMHPTVISHGYGQGYVAEFDWVGTRDATAQFSLPEALSFREALGDEAVRRYNRDLVLAASDALAEAWGTEVGAAPALVGSMRCVRLPDGFSATAEGAQALRDRLMDEFRIQVPIRDHGGALWARLSAQIYNAPDDYDRLRDAITSLAA